MKNHLTIEGMVAEMKPTIFLDQTIPVRDFEVSFNMDEDGGNRAHFLSIRAWGDKAALLDEIGVGDQVRVVVLVSSYISKNKNKHRVTLREIKKLTP